MSRRASPGPTVADAGVLSLRARLVAILESDSLALPMMPDTAAEVVSTCHGTDCDARALSDLIDVDPSLAANVLRVANSAAYAPLEPIVSLTQAVSRLGFATICNIAIAVALRGDVFRLPGHENELELLWAHSAVAGAWAREVARMRRRNVEAAFLCGLLHDVGRPLVLQHATALGREAGIEVPALTRRAWGDELHARIGARMIAHWGLPDWTSEAIAQHHDPDPASARVDEARTTQLADLLSHWSLGLGPDLEGALRAHPVLRDLGLYFDELDELLEAKDRVLSVAEVYA